MAQTIKPNTRILVAESHEIIRIGLRTLISNQPSLDLIAEVDCVDKLFEQAEKYQPQVILLDLLLGNGDFFKYISRLYRRCPQTRILAYSSNNDEKIQLQVLRAGAAGIVAVNQNTALLLKAINAVAMGEVWFDHQLTKLLWKNNLHETIHSYEGEGAKNSSTNLTERERSIARLAAQGLKAKKIGEQLAISEKTVRNQLTTIYDKIGVVGQVELCLKASEINF
jgi:DNA-binding NarL/FixJ family response regulator